MLTSWSDENIALIEQLAAAFSHQDHYAVFDADGTLWQNDLSEALLAYLEQKSIVESGQFPPSMFPVPILKNEPLLSYYARLCREDTSLGYFWLCQCFKNFSLGELDDHIASLLTNDAPIKSLKMTTDGSMAEQFIQRPKIFKWQQELISFLRKNEIDVYVVTAALEELVRMVVSNPVYEFSIPFDHVVGMKMAVSLAGKKRLLKSNEKKLTTDYYNSRLTPSLSGITPWHSGKVAAIRMYIDPDKRPVLAAGDSESDHEMLDYSAPAPGLKFLVKNGRPEAV